jgi:hypothetical protein
MKPVTSNTSFPTTTQHDCSVLCLRTSHRVQDFPTGTEEASERGDSTCTDIHR